MTLIECYTDSHIDNIAACLALRPDRMILIGDARKATDALARYEALLQRRGHTAKLQFEDISGFNFTEIYRLLKELTTNREEDLVIDLTGGDELVIMAVGAVLANMEPPQRDRVLVQKYDRTEHIIQTCCGGNVERNGTAPTVSIEEILLLHGGTLHPDSRQPAAEYPARALDQLWAFVAEDPRKWNRSVALLNELESRCEEKMRISLPIETLSGSIPNFHDKNESIRSLLSDLQSCGVIENNSTDDTIEYNYSSPMMRHCLEKAGNVLEIKTLLEGRAVTKNGLPFFHDCRMSVGIDWDGILHTPMERMPETRNEIDVVLMRHLTPLFISCKNGSIGEEELYKLHTVASRFGGPNVRKMLIATDLNQKSAFSNRAFMQRAWDMDIFLVPDAANLSPEEWQDIFYKAMF